MADFEDRLARAREHVAPAWTPERERNVRARVEARLETGRQRRVVALSFATLALLVGGLFAWHRVSIKSVASVTPRGVPAQAVVRGAPELLHFEDGSSVTAVTADARAEPVLVDASTVTVRLVSGAARFSVTPNPTRTFRVLAQDTTVTVLGTVFTVALGPDGVQVSVERGRVHVEWPAGDRVLTVGEQVLASGDATLHAGAPNAPNAPAIAPAADASPSDRAQRASPSASPPIGPSWRALAQDGDYARAFARIAAEGPSAVRDEPGDLLLSADVARLGGHPDKAIAPLERVLSAHAGDSRAPLAAFTLGRTLLDQLGRPVEAAHAFATARKLDAHGALAQDALAREVESWSRAGDAATAHERATEFATAYPNGRRLKAVKRLGSLD